jgi:DNA-binding XRE family transcriptional regulator
MRPSVSCINPGAARSRRTQCRQLAAAIQARRVQFNMTIQQAAEFAGLGPKLWVDLESGWIPPQDDGNLWIWWALAASLEVKAERLFCLASADLAHEGLLAKERVA